MVTLYSTGCPRCKVLEKKLTQKNIEFELKTDFDVNAFLEKGFSSVPLLEVDGEIFTFEKANQWINNN